MASKKSTSPDLLFLSKAMWGPGAMGSEDATETGERKKKTLDEELYEGLLERQRVNYSTQKPNEKLFRP
jgi:hypothetical protein